MTKSTRVFHIRRTSSFGGPSVQVMRSLWKFVPLGLSALGLVSIGSAQVQNKAQNRPKPPVQTPLPAHPPQRLHVTVNGGSPINWRAGYTPYPGVTIYRVHSFNRYVDSYSYGDSVVLCPFYFYPNMPPFIQNGPLPGDGDTQNPADAVVDMLSSPGPDSKPVKVTPTTDTPNSPSNVNLPVEPDPDSTIADLKSAWNNSSLGVIDRLVPKTGEVKVSVADVSYDLKADDFFELLSDGVAGTKTLSWKVMDEHVDGDSVTLRAIHTFQDPWGKARSISQTYALKFEGSAYVIRAFGSEPYVDQSANPDGSTR